MELTHEFSVKVPIDEAWAVLTDLERVAPCMPGLELREAEGGAYRGVVTVKVGPMVARYQGAASFRERDEATHRAVVRAEGREMRGQGNAAATVTATLAPAEGGTRVTLHTDLAISGRVAQFGRGVLADVSSRLLRQFVEALEADLRAGTAPADTGAQPGGAVDVPRAPAPGGPRRSETTPGPPLDLLAAAGPSLVKRAGPLVIAIVLAVALWLLLRG